MSALEAAELAGWIAPGRCALVIVDMQADFADPGGALGRAGVDVTPAAPALDQARRLARAARRSGVAVVFVGLGTNAATDSAVWAERERRLADGASEPLCRIGSPGAAFVGPLPQAGELVIEKTRYSGFHGTDLGRRLQGLGVDTLVICGLTTECCVDATARDAYQHDFHVFVAADACAAYDADLHRAALRGMALNCAIVTSTNVIVEAWRISGR